MHLKMETKTEVYSFTDKKEEFIARVFYRQDRTGDGKPVLLEHVRVDSVITHEPARRQDLEKLVKLQLGPGVKTILVIDDDIETAEITRKLLLKIFDENSLVCTAGSVANAHLTLSRAEFENVDIIISDYNIGTEDGLIFLETMKITHPKTKLILMSGNYTPKPKDSTYINNFLSKPFGIKELKIVVM